MFSEEREFQVLKNTTKTPTARHKTTAMMTIARKMLPPDTTFA
jgi:hypothetical protein